MPAFAKVGDVALFVAGLLMAAAGVFVVDQGAVQTVLILMGAGLMVMGAVLPRLSGTVKLGPGSVEMTVVQQLEATRREAERLAPEHVEEAVGLAFSRLAESGALTHIPAPAHHAAGPAGVGPPAPLRSRPDPSGATDAPPAARSPLRRSPLAAAASLVVLLGVGVSLLLFAGAGSLRAVPGPSLSDGAEASPMLLGAGAMVLFIGLVSLVALLVLRSGRRGKPPEGPAPDLPEDFARRIVDEVMGRS